MGLIRDAALTVTYLFVDGTGLTRSIDRNLGTDASQTFTVGGSGETVSAQVLGQDRPFANFARVIAFESSATSRYNGLTAELNRRFSGDMQIRLAYTLGKIVDTGAGRHRRTPRHDERRPEIRVRPA